MALSATDLLLTLALIFPILGSPQECFTGLACIPISQCRFNSDDILYPCHSGLNLICCPPGSYNSTGETIVDSRKTALFPVDCGVVALADKITGGSKALLGQFPWMTLLGYIQRGVNITQFLCGGSLITESYVLTAAHCLNMDRRLELVIVRLGEHNLLSQIDCTFNNTECADRPIDNPVQNMIQHPNFNSQSLENDIALLKTRMKFKFTDFVRPICLPFGRDLSNISNHKLTVSGWGRTKAANLGGSTILQYTAVRVWNQVKCNKTIPPEVSPLKDTQLCANGDKEEDACRGDSGGPLVNATVDLDGELRYFQIGIVSFASTMTCGNRDLPTVYTRVDKYLNWIMNSIS